MQYRWIERSRTSAMERSRDYPDFLCRMQMRAWARREWEADRAYAREDRERRRANAEMEKRMREAGADVKTTYDGTPYNMIHEEPSWWTRFLDWVMVR